MLFKNSSSYSPPAWLYNGHLQTIIPSLFRKVPGVLYKRERISTPDEDFLDLDWLESDSEDLIIISHGLEGDSHRHYVKGMAKAFNKEGWEVMAWNFRGCSGEMNKLLRFYHSGATDDLHYVVNHALAKKQYKRIALVGFSLGGNLTLKYLGEYDSQLPKEIIGSAVVSVPIHLHSSCQKISEVSNGIYSRRFLRNLKKKIRAKSLKMPDRLHTGHFKKINSLQDFDDFYTAPIHGFKDAASYYEACSAIHFLERIAVPTLIINAVNDPFLSEQCYPVNLLEKHPHVHLEMPREGGHCGFPVRKGNGIFWSEKRAVEFLTELLQH